ncbi:MAG: 16S rRNA (cytidine(1402)-2'-O)-methyltransferase [Clostridia bacterium]
MKYTRFTGWRRSRMLYLVATPIGNLGDISKRALDALESCDVIACEDTRRTIKLLNAYNIKKKMIAFHMHNEAEMGARILEMAGEGMTICLVSDAGSPGISDPGESLVKLFYENNMKVSIIPGPNAALSGLVLSGLSTTRFVFEGFLPSTMKKRKDRLVELAFENRTMVFYEAPHRLNKCLGDMIEIFGADRKAAVVREITKVFEETLRGTLAELNLRFLENQPKGEFVIVVEGRNSEKTVRPAKSVEETYENLLAAGNDRKEAMRIIAKEYNISRREVYSRVNKD